MTSKTNFKRSAFRGSSALQALALLGAGVGVSAAMIAPAAAQDYTNVTASGKVQGTDGKAIGGATIELKSDDQGFTRTVTTDASGGFRIPQIPQGNYTFTITASGFDTYTEAGIALSQSASANQFTLAAAGSSGNGDIVVTAGRIQVADFEKTTTGAVINVGELATRVPVARDLNSIIQLAPGTAVGDSSFGSLSSIVGSSVSENVFYVNGLNITEFRQGLGSVTVPFDFYETVDIKDGGYQAEFGRATGGFVNATTKSGSNEFHGSVTFNWEPNDLKSNAKNTLTADNDNDFRERKEAIFQLSGPIIKDHLFFYGLYNTRDVQSGDGIQAGNFCTTTAYRNQFRPAANGGPVVTQGCTSVDQIGNLLTINGTTYGTTRTRSPFYGGKIDAIIVDGQKLEFTYFNTGGTSFNNTYAYTGTANVTNTIGAYQGQSVSEYGGENYVGRYTGTFFPWLTVSAAYGKGKNNSITGSSRNGYPTIIDQRSGSSVNIGNTTQGLSTANDTREFYRADADVYFKLFGSHHLKFGYDREDLTSFNTTAYTGGVAYTLSTGGPTDTYGVPSGQQYVVARTFVNGGTFQSRNQAFYIQDSWSLFNNRLTIQAGLRDDKFVNRNVDGDVYYDSGDNYQPRIGATLDPFGDGRTKIYGSFSRYYLPIATNTNIRLGGAELDYDRVNLLNGLNADNTPIIGSAVLFAGAAACPDTSTRNCTIRNDGSVTPTDSAIAKNLENQSVDEYILGAEQRIGRRWKVGIYGTYRSLNASLEDAAIDQGIIKYCQSKNIAGCQNIWTGSTQYILLNPGKDIDVTLNSPLPGKTTRETVHLTADQLGYPEAKRTYKAVIVTIDREFDGVWSLSGSYTWSKNEGNIEGGVKSDNGQVDSGLTTDFDFPSLMLGSYGYLPNDRRHNFKLYGSVKPFDFLQLGASFTLTSPRKFGCLGRVASTISSPALIAAGTSYDYGYAYGAAGHFCVRNSDGSIRTTPAKPTVAGQFGGTNEALDRSQVDRGSVFQSDWLSNLNVDVAFKIPTDQFDATLRMSVFNVLNSQAKLDFNETGTTAAGDPSPSYGRVTLFQQPRYVRLQLGVGF